MHVYLYRPSALGGDAALADPRRRALFELLRKPAAHGGRTRNVKVSLRKWMRSRARVVLAAVVALGCRTGAPPTGGPSASSLERVNEARFAAMLRKDFASLDQLLANHLTYTHTDGSVDTKESFLGALRSGAVVYDSIVAGPVRVQQYGATGVVTGQARIQVRVAGAVHRLGMRYTAVYVHGEPGDTWRLVAWQATQQPSP
jgi:hypothetical protein